MTNLRGQYDDRSRLSRPDTTTRIGDAAIKSGTQESATLKAGNRIPTLDGWRGIAILMVIIDHFQIYFFPDHMPFHHWAWLLTGEHGVAVFFVLSGYLITNRLLAEDRIDLKRFYLRRFFRLMPTAWAYLLFLALFGMALGGSLIRGDEALSCLFFYRNFVLRSAGPLTSHFWSLSVEEQFYLVWPVILAVAGRRARWFPLAGSVAIGFLALTHRWPYGALLVGCALAFASKRTGFCDWIRTHHRWIFPVSLAGFAGCNALYHFDIPLIEWLLTALMLACTSFNPRSWAYNVLERRHLKTLGAYSYSFYVWQQFFLVMNPDGFGIFVLPVIAIVSWLYIEQPGIRFGARLLTAKTSRLAETVHS